MSRACAASNKNKFADEQRLKHRRKHKDMTAESEGAQIGEKAPEFFIEISNGNLPLHHLAGRHRKLVITSQDSYQYHPN